MRYKNTSYFHVSSLRQSSQKQVQDPFYFNLHQLSILYKESYLARMAINRNKNIRWRIPTDIYSPPIVWRRSFLRQEPLYI